ncbi:hypothetical protein [Lacticaseibacillus camelliae]|uniref:Uncharacterized protein n=1 Tax=Lacticaseibacillus camelliae DSM 22697 = JCM 13995 TaxID=1423730 RepID=A0A0R2EXJ2_9LACO|nr:hypothetical protein [Lacticaseibacillus camelliae]KRN18645.1 hypothetical protein FC75_GL000585 [Lacticaseibacillus camelliae DSM 22697 = JCM 13995]
MGMTILKWTLRVLVAVTVVLLVINTVFGIGLIVVDMVFGGVYLMQRNKCDRRQLHRLDLMHRF